jgi:hypothetical protein
VKEIYFNSMDFDMKHFRDIVADYKKRYREAATKELRWFAIQSSLESAVSVAALAKGPSGKRLSHQRRIPETVLLESRRRLLDVLPEIEAVTTFEQLHEVVQNRIGPIVGIGELTVYDTALRIGARLRLEPTVVFMHAGTRDGAKKLGLDTARPFIPASELPREFHELQPHEMEDVLCLYKNNFKRGCLDAEVQPNCYREIPRSQ